MMGRLILFLFFDNDDDVAVAVGGSSKVAAVAFTEQQQAAFFFSFPFQLLVGLVWRHATNLNTAIIIILVRDKSIVGGL